MAFKRETSGENKTSPPCPEAAIGIDIGTSRCSFAVWNGSKVEILHNKNKKTLQSFVSFRDKTPITGVSGQISLEEELQCGKVAFNLKSSIGKDDTDPYNILGCTSTPFLAQKFGAGLQPFSKAMDNNTWKPTIPEILLAIFLVEIRAMAEAQLKRRVRYVVVTSPVSFSRFQLFMIATACTLAGFVVLRQMPEPTAVALLYAQQQRQDMDESMESTSEKIALIFNIGAGFCDVVVTATDGGGICRIKALSGNAVGGEVILQNMIRHLLPEFDVLLSSYESDDIKAVALLRAATESVMHKLSSECSVEIDVELGNGMKVSKTVERREFEDVNRTVFERCECLLRQCLRDSNVEPKDLADVILVGGCSCIPRIRNIVSSVCQKEEFYGGISPLEGAVCGVALDGAVSSGIINPDGNLKLLIIQATRFSIGIRVYGSDSVPIIPRNTATPTRKELVFTTVHDNQDEALIAVYEGEESEIEGNHLLGHSKVKGIPPGPRGVPEIKVSMEIDTMNMLRVYVAAAQLMEVRLPLDGEWHGPCADDLNKIYGSTLDLIAVQRNTQPMCVVS